MYFSNIFNNKCVCVVKEDWDSKTKSVKTINTNRFDSVICFFTLQLKYYCRKQMSFDLEDWWIMLLHHIGLPPAINRNSKFLVSGNILYNNYIHIWRT